MSATTGDAGAEAQRLEELERVTRDYARFAGVSGVPLAVLAAWEVAGTLALPALTGRLLLVAGPLVWAAAAAVSIRLYLTHGVVLKGRSLRLLALVVLYVNAAVLLAETAVAHWYRPLVPRPIALGLALLVLVAIIAIAHRLAHGAADLTVAWIALGLAGDAMRDRWFLGELWRPAFATMWAAMLVFGVVMHRRSRALEQRIAALRERAP